MEIHFHGDSLHAYVRALQPMCADGSGVGYTVELEIAGKRREVSLVDVDNEGLTVRDIGSNGAPIGESYKLDHMSVDRVTVF